METNPAYYGLSRKIELKELDKKQIAILKVIKSRIIQKDAIKIVSIAQKIKSVNPDLEVTLICTQNICSKSIALLENEGISIFNVESVSEEFF